jgi:catechol 2,3-dioxygenase-like lactoylglutathione lyase family enzyme
MTEQNVQSQNVLGIVHVAIAVSDLQQHIEFWQQVLGFKLDGTAEVGGALPEDETGVPGIRSKIAQLTNYGLSIELYEPTAPEDRRTYRPSPVDIGSWHLAFKVSDLDDIIRVSAKWGWQVRGKVAVVEEGPGPVGARLAYLHNADGTIIELVQLPKVE